MKIMHPSDYEYRRFHVRLGPGKRTTVSVNPTLHRQWLKHSHGFGLRELIQRIGIELITSRKYSGSLSRAVRERVSDVLIRGRA